MELILQRSIKLQFWIRVADDVVRCPGVVAWWNTVAPRHLAGAFVPAKREVKLKFVLVFMKVFIAYRSFVHANNIFKLIELASCEAVFASLEVFEQDWLASIDASAVSFDAAIGAEALFVFSLWPFHASVVFFRLILEFG